MIKNVEVHGWERAVQGMRRSWDSGSLSDTTSNSLGYKDITLIKKLVKAGPDHRKMLRAVSIWMDIEGTLKWWKQFDTYKVGTVALSDSTMHTLMTRDLDESCFSRPLPPNTLRRLKEYWKLYRATKDPEMFERLTDELPSCFLQTRTVLMNYEVALSIYKARKSHKLREWKQFCFELGEKVLYLKELLRV